MINYTSGEKCHKIYERSTAILFYCDKTTSEVSFKTCFLYILSSRLALFFKVWKVKVKSMNMPNDLQIRQAIQRSVRGQKKEDCFESLVYGWYLYHCSGGSVHVVPLRDVYHYQNSWRSF